jgi:hypothetical protein
MSLPKLLEVEISYGRKYTIKTRLSDSEHIPLPAALAS